MISWSMITTSFIITLILADRVNLTHGRKRKYRIIHVVDEIYELLKSIDMTVLNNVYIIRSLWSNGKALGEHFC